jgi:type III secretion protein W
MAVNIGSAGPVIAAVRLQAETRRQESVKAADDGMAQAADAENADDGTPAALQQKLADMADDMANVAAQFRNRRAFEQKGVASGEGFERVLEEDAAPKAQRLVEVLALQNLTLNDVMAQARSLFPDESDLDLVLRELLKRKQLSLIQRKRLERLLEQVEREADPKLLKGGINCALKARLFGAALELKASLLRQTYRRFLESDRKPLADYEDWIASYGYRPRHMVLDFVEESLGTDIRAEDPSCSHLEFGSLLARMRKLHLLRTADRDFVQSLLARKLMPAHAANAEEEADWLLLLCHLIRQERAPAELLTQMLEACLLRSHAERSVLLNAVRSAYKRLPEQLFEDECDFDAPLAVFDRLIDRSYAAELLEQRRLASRPETRPPP